MEAEAEVEAKKNFWMEAEAEAKAKKIFEMEAEAERKFIFKMEAEAEAVQKFAASTSLVLQDIGPLGPIPCSRSTTSFDHSMKGIGYNWPCAILGWLVKQQCSRKQ